MREISRYQRTSEYLDTVGEPVASGPANRGTQCQIGSDDVFVPARHVLSTESTENTLRCGKEIILLRQIAGRDRDGQHHQPATAGIVQFLQTDVA